MSLSAPSPHRSHGLTLVEIMVALSLLAILGLMSYRGVSQLQQGSQQLGAQAQRWREIALVTERLGRDATQAVALATGPAWSARQDDDVRELVLLRVGPDNGDLQRVGYRWQGDGALYLLVWSSRDPAQPPRSHLLLDGVRAVEFAHLDLQGRWQLPWPPATGREVLPRALRLRLALQEGGQIERIFDVPAAL